MKTEYELWSKVKGGDFVHYIKIWREGKVESYESKSYFEILAKVPWGAHRKGGF